LLFIRIYWFPYFIYLCCLIKFYDFVTIFAKDRVITRKLGRSYKLAIKLLNILTKTWEVKRIMKGVRYNVPRDYVCKCDKKLPKEDQTIFRVRFLTTEEQADIRDGLYGVTGVGASRKEVLKTGSTTYKALELGLLGWENFKYEDTGEAIPFSIENFSCIAPAERDEIANYIRGINETEGI